MPPGAYAVTVSLEGGGGQRQEATIQVAVDPLPPIPQTGRPPVLLLNGFQFSPCQASKSEDIFGELPSYLKADGVFPLFFDNCVECRKCEIEKLGDRLGQYLTALRYTDGTTVPEVDIVAHSMGGLIVRSYLTGKQSSPGVFNPPTTTKVRKAIFTGTPHFGARIAGLTIGSQARAMSPGSRFLWELSQWNQGVDDLRGTDALAIIGAGGFSGDAQGASDGVVALTSASLSFAFGYPDERTRIVPYCHIELSILRCHNRTPLAKVDSETHLTSAIVRSFLSDTDAWKRLGWSPSQDPYLSHQAGMYFAFQDSSGTVFTDITRVRYTTDRGTFLMDESTDGIWHTEWVSSGTVQLNVHLRGREYPVEFQIPSGQFANRFLKFGPIISFTLPAAGQVNTINLAPGSLVSIFGVNLASGVEQAQALPLPTELGGTVVSANRRRIPLLYAGPNQINAYLPQDLSTLSTFSVFTSTGSDTTNLVHVPAVPAIFTLNGSGTGAAAAINAVTGRLIDFANPIAAGDHVTLFVTGLGRTVRSGNVDVAVVTPTVGIFPREKDIAVIFAGLTPGFVGLYQINFQIPPDVQRGPAVRIVVLAEDNVSNIATLNIR